MYTTNKSLPTAHTPSQVRLLSSSKLYFVRLADSDIGSNTKGAPPEALEARKWSNKSFTTLGSCLKAVSDRARIVPVRDSALTRMLRDSFGQGCNISIVGQCVLADDDAEETVGTLRYIHRLLRQTSSKPPSAAPSKTNGVPNSGAINNNSSINGINSRSRIAGAEESDMRRQKQSSQNSGPSDANSGQAPPLSRTVASHRDSAGAGAAAAAAAHPVQDELARAWTYAFHLENLIVWIAEVFQVRLVAGASVCLSMRVRLSDCICVCVCFIARPRSSDIGWIDSCILCPLFVYMVWDRTLNIFTLFMFP